MGSRRRNAVRLAVLAASTLVALPVGASAAVAAPTTSILRNPVVAAFVEEVGMQTIRNQDALMDLRGWMLEQPGFTSSGYVGSIDDLPNKATTIMWYGARTPLLDAIITEGSRRGIRVSVQPRRYSLPQLEAAAQAIWRQQAEGLWPGFEISAIETVGAVEDGLTVTGRYATTTTTAADSASGTRPLPTAVNGIPVRLKPGEVATAQLGRGTDFSPFYAGGYMISPSTGGLCSNGFAIKLSGVSRTTTARHCWADDYQSRDASGTSHQYGPDIATSFTGVRVLTKPGAPAMFQGAWNTGSWLVVRGVATLAVNNFVCTSGGNSGQHCNIKVSNLSVFWNDGSGVISTIRGDQQTPGAITSMQGDSGGPVFTIVANGVRAAGMIQAGVQGTLMFGSACGSVRDVGEPFRGGQAFSCSRSLLFTSAAGFTDGMNAQIQIAP